jgi:hypothetical protein
MLVLCRKAGESVFHTKSALLEPAATVLLRSLLRREPALVLSVRLDLSTCVEQHRATPVRPSALRPPL